MASQQYNYQAIDAQGSTLKGQIAADSEQEVVSILQARKLVPVQVSMGSETQGGLGFDLSALSRRSVSNADLIDFTSGLCTLMETYVPLDRALMLLAGLTNKPAMQTLISDLRREVKEGKSLADALRTHPETFSRMYINIVHAGEEGGILDKLLPRLEKFLKDAEESKRTIISAMTYPAILGIVGIISVILLLTFMVPMFANVFEDMGSEIPDAAAFLLGVSNWLQSYGWVLLFIPVAIWYGWRHWSSTSERRLHRDTTLIKMPLLGTLLLQGESSRFCRTLGALLGSGIPLLRGLHIVRGVMENQHLISQLTQVEENVRGGTSLGRALINADCFPTLLPQLIIVGEESGRTAEVLDKLAESFDERVKQQTTRILSLVEPVLIVTIGGLVGGIVMIMFSAIFSINNVDF